MNFNLAQFSLDMRLKAAERRMKLHEVAEAVKSSKATISRINREVGLPDVETFGRCCKWLGKPMETYFSNSVKAF